MSAAGHPRRRGAILALLAAGAMLATLVGAAPASAQGAYWRLESRSAPTNLPLGGEGMIIAVATNFGAGEVNGKGVPITFVDTLPEGVKAIGLTALTGEGIRGATSNQVPLSCTPKPTPTEPAEKITCSFAEGVPSYEHLEMEILVKTPATGPPNPENEVTVSGGEAPPEQKRFPVAVNGAPTPFGVEDFEMIPEEADGSIDHQAGSHPFQLTTTFNLNQGFGHENIGDLPVPEAPALQKTLNFKLPPGLIGDPNAVQQCSDANFGVFGEKDINNCPDSSVIGVAQVAFNDPTIFNFQIWSVPLFNLTPAPGEPARFGFEVVHVPVILNASVRTGEGYGVTVTVKNTSEAVQVLGATVSFWGVPGDPSHDEARGWNCLGSGHWVERFTPPHPCPEPNEPGAPFEPSSNTKTTESKMNRANAESTYRLETNQLIRLEKVTSGVTTLKAGELYWIVKVGPSEFEVSETKGGTAIKVEGHELEAASTEWKVPHLPFLNLPAVCPEEVLSNSVSGDAWNGETLHSEASNPAKLECKEKLPFTPTVNVRPDQHDTSTPTGLTIELHVPLKESTLKAGKNDEADIKETVLELPPSVQANGGSADGLAACGVGEAGFFGQDSDKFEEGGGALNKELEEQHFTPEPAACPNAAKLGTVEINTPTLPRPLHGALYLGSQDANPFAPPLVFYLVATEEEPIKKEGSKVLVKLAGAAGINPTTGQLVSTFKNGPPLPFETLKVHLFNTERASQATPAHCGSYEARAKFGTWSSTETTERPETEAEKEAMRNEFQITSGPNGGPCPGATLPYSPSVSAGPVNTQAGEYTPFTMTIKRPDGDQEMTGLTVHLPPGAAAKLASATPCPMARANAGTCGPESEIGVSTTRTGLGGDPYNLPGTVFLTEGFDGAPFGISDLTHAEHVGPFNVGTIVANSTINVDPNTSAATITVKEVQVKESDGQTKIESTLPTRVKGVPAQIKELNVTVNRPNFEFNPTNCGSHSISGLPMEVGVSLTGDEGGSVGASSPYSVSNCAALPFHPELTAEASGHGSKLNGTAFVVKVKSSPGQANVAKTFLTLPIQLPSRLTTIQKACLDTVFEANPAGCDEGSNIGMAISHTPVLKSPLIGPAYLVSHGNAAFPDVEFVLQGEGIKIVLDGKTDIKNGITYSRFETVPDAPVEMFEAVFPAGPHSALTANVPESENFSLCNQTLTMPTEITGQNGAVIKTVTKVAITGCGPKAATKLTQAQKLAKALSECRKKYKSAKKRKQRLACEARARKLYGPKKAKKAKKAAAHKKR